jgi:hypothetical protein
MRDIVASGAPRQDSVGNFYRAQQDTLAALDRTSPPRVNGEAAPTTY